MARPGLLAPPLPAPPPVPTTTLLLLLLLLPRPHALSWPHTPPGPHAQVLGVQKEVLLWAQTSGWCAVAPHLRLSPFGQFDLNSCQPLRRKGRERTTSTLFAGTRCVDRQVV